MPSVSRTLRTLAVIAALALVGVGLAFGRGAAPGAAVAQARAMGAMGAPDLIRPPWFGLRVLDDSVSFHAGTAPIRPPDIPAAGGILIDVDAEAILWQHNAHLQLPPASTTKILTALVALENFSPAQEVTVTAASLHQAWDETRMGISAGQRYTVEELLTGMLLVSGNDAATAIAQDTVGLERFVAAMNAEVSALGLRDSHFTSPVGLQDAQQYTSAYDLAAISVAVVRHFPLFGQIVATPDATLATTADHPGFDLHSINQLLGMYPYAVGIKPGWTGDAGNCLVGMAVRGGHRLISVLLNAPYDFRQSRKLLDWGFTQEGLASTLPTPTPTPTPKVHG
jgi:serine-type D-Ala-D-Ala carboxypeptidase (penicillin-binding protein 5/6)